MDILRFDGAHSSAITQSAQQRLRESPYFYLRNLTCQFSHGVLTLQGKVPYQPLKQVAESIVSRVEGVVEVNNRIEVVHPDRNNPVRHAG